MADLHNIWKHHAAYLKEIHDRKDNCTHSKPANNAKLRIGQEVMVQNYVHQTFDFEPKYLNILQSTKILNESSFLLITPNRKECKMNIHDIKPYIILELTGNACNSFLNSIKTN